MDMPPVVSDRALNRALLQRQWLLEKVDATAENAVDHLIGLQAQLGDPPYYQLWSRLREFSPQDLSSLLLERKVVRIVTMRGTIHLVRAADCFPLRDLTQVIMDREVASGSRKQVVEQVNPTLIAREGQRILRGGPRSSVEIGERLAQRWPAFRPNHLVSVLRNVLPLVQTPPRGVWGQGGALTYAHAAQWLGMKAQAVADPQGTIRRYLRAFGPATVLDYQKWCGLSKQREHFERLRPQLITYTDAVGKELFDIPNAPVPAEDMEVPLIKIIGPFDNLVLSHARRDRIMDQRAWERLATPNGQFPGMFLRDGMLAGVWFIDRKNTAATIRFELFHNLSTYERDLLEHEGEELLRFAAPDSQQRHVTFVPDGSLSGPGPYSHRHSTPWVRPSASVLVRANPTTLRPLIPVTVDPISSGWARPGKSKTPSSVCRMAWVGVFPTVQPLALMWETLE
ncbi:AlkZ family DNA glycosylase [Natronoglycomyces albus]|uniref:AlkZ family DNA glycosylase n=1 Tax=Natronoglycomyces albus TaxID=2811108 RepID=A0A895XR69_9ACTN|nr:AlkZ family DNA glycosylase [Natronoglycomyces albus]